MIKQLLLVGLGGGLGSMLRYATSLLIKPRLFPFATLTVNILGCFIIGLVFALSVKQDGISGNWKIFLASGICGGFTTFSAFSMENILLLQSGKTGLAFIYIVTSIVLGIGAAFAGYQLMIKNQLL